MPSSMTTVSIPTGMPRCCFPKMPSDGNGLGEQSCVAFVWLMSVRFRPIADVTAICWSACATRRMAAGICEKERSA